MMAYQETFVQRDQHRIYVRDHPGAEPAIILMHGFPDNVHLYDRLSPYLSPPRRVVLFDFLGWGSSDKPTGYPYTTANQVGDLDAVITQLGLGQVVLVAHDASGPPAIDNIIKMIAQLRSTQLSSTSTNEWSNDSGPRPAITADAEADNHPRRDVGEGRRSAFARAVFDTLQSRGSGQSGIVMENAADRLRRDRALTVEEALSHSELDQARDEIRRLRSSSKRFLRLITRLLWSMSRSRTPLIVLTPPFIGVAAV